MENLIKALQIFLKYGNPTYPTTCEHDTLYVVGYDDKEFSKDDIAELNKLGFEYDEELGSWVSFTFGSA
jgi:hypothetical protein